MLVDQNTPTRVMGIKLQRIMRPAHDLLLLRANGPDRLSSRSEDTLQRMLTDEPARTVRPAMLIVVGRSQSLAVVGFRVASTTW